MFSRAYLLSVVIVLALCCVARAQGEPKRVSVAVLEMGSGPTAARVSERLAKLLVEVGAHADLKFSMLDRDMTRAAARGAGYSGSLNMTTAEARSLGASVGCDFYVTGDAQTIRRSSSTRP